MRKEAYVFGFWRRFIAVVLSLSLLVGICGIIPTAQVQAAEESNFVVYEDFEDCTANENSGIWQTTTGSAKWNNATPANWNCFVTNPEILAEVSTEQVYEGSYALKVTPDTEDGGAAGLIYTLTNEEAAMLEDGAEYTVKAWVRAATNTVGVKLQLTNLCGASVIPYTTTVNAGWYLFEYTFTASLVEGSKTIRINMHGANMDAMYVDMVTLEKVNKVSVIQLDRAESYLEVDQRLQLGYTLTPSYAVTDVTFSSSDTDVATVDENGIVTAIAEGITVITATANNGNAKTTCTIYVVENYVQLTGISLEKTELRLNPGGREQLSIILNPSDATETKAIWTSSDENVVTVTEDGVVSAVTEGTATVIATVGNFSATCDVTVAESDTFKSVTKDIMVGFGQKEFIDLTEILEGDSYSILTTPARGNIALDGGNISYTSYTWQQEGLVGDYVDAQYKDSLKISVAKGAEFATITLNITIDTLASLLESQESISLLFTEEYLEQIKDEIRNNDAGRMELFQQLRDVAYSYKYAAAPAYSDPTADGYAGDENQRLTGTVTVTYLMAYLLTKDVEDYEEDNNFYLEKTIYWLKASLEMYPFWDALSSQNGGLAAGHQTFSTALCYYWLKEELADVTCNHYIGSDSTDKSTWTVIENQPILEAMEQRFWQVGRDMYKVNMNYPAYLLNHTQVRMAGLLTMALSMYDTATDAEKAELVKWIGMALFKNGHAANAAMPDGTSQEGLYYAEYSMIYMLKLAMIARTALNIDLFDMTGIYSDSTDFFLYTSLSSNEWTGSQAILNIGDNDGVHTYSPSATLRVLAAEYGNSVAQWLAIQYENSDVIAYGGDVWLSVLFGNPDLEATEPDELELLKWFDDLDIVISRSDWSGNEDILMLKCGLPMGKNLVEMITNDTYPGEASAGHAHPDANHITLYSNGEYLLRDDSYAYKYTSNHNTLLVNSTGQMNGNGEHWFMDQNSYIYNNSQPQIVVAEEVIENDYSYDYIVGDATAAYASTLGLDLFERHVVYLKDEQVMLVVDNIKVDSNAELELRWFPTSKNVAVTGGIYQISGDLNTLSFFNFTNDATFEDVDVTFRNPSSVTEKAFRQVYTGTEWQNAVAFAWDEANGSAAYVVYKAGENENEHMFGVNGKIYIVNVETNSVTVAEGELDVEDGNESNDSTLSTVTFNNVAYSEFDPAVTEYTVNRWWKTYDLDVVGYANSYGGKTTVDMTDPQKILVSCISLDGTSSTTYTFHITNTNNILGIGDATSDLTSEGGTLSSTYDNVIQVLETTPKWTVKSPTEGENAGKVTVIYDLVDLVFVNKIDFAPHKSSYRDTYFDIYTSVDGGTWTPLIEDGVHEQTEDMVYGHEYRTVYDGEDVTLRYVKVILRGHSGSGKDALGAWNGIQEITFFGASLADSDNNDSADSGDNAGGNIGDSTGNNTGDNTGDSTGSNTGDSTGSNTEGNTGNNTGDSTGSNREDSTGSNTEGNTGNNTEDNTANNIEGNVVNSTAVNTGDSGNVAGWLSFNLAGIICLVAGMFVKKKKFIYAGIFSQKGGL